MDFVRSLLLLVVAATRARSAKEETAHHHQFVIVGAGPGGLQFGLQLLEAGVKDFVILEKEPAAGTFFTLFPRKRDLISVNRQHLAPSFSPEFALRHDWHTLLGANRTFSGSGYSGKWFPKAAVLVSYLQEIAAGLPVVYGVEVVSAEAAGGDGGSVVRAEDGRVWTADHLVVATGYRLRDLPKCLADAANPVYTYDNMPIVVGGAAEFCQGKKAFVFGGGNAAFETADILSPCTHSVVVVYKHPPRFSYLTHYVGDLRMHNAAIFDRYQLKSLDGLVWAGELESEPERLMRRGGPRPGGLEEATEMFKTAGFSPKRFYREQLESFYRAHNSSMLGNVGATLSKYKGREQALFAKLRKKYALATSSWSSATALSSGRFEDAGAEFYRMRLGRFYGMHNKKKLRNCDEKGAWRNGCAVDDTLAKYSGREDELFEALLDKYAYSPSSSPPLGHFGGTKGGAMGAVAPGCEGYAPFLQLGQNPANEGSKIAVFAGGFTTRREGLVDAGDTGAGKFPAVGPFWEDPTHPSKWYAGAAMHGIDYLQSAGGFVHGFRYLVKAQVRHILRRHYGQPWPSTSFECFRDAVKHATKRIQESSGLYQMNAVLVDVLVPLDDGTVLFYPEVPKPWLAEELGRDRDLITVELDYSDKKSWTPDLLFDPNRIDR